MTRSRSLAAGLVLTALFVGAGTIAVGSTFLKVDIPTLNRMSESVIHARVVDVESAWNAEGSMIFTHVTLQVIGRLRGAGEDRIVVRVPGGTVGDFTSEMEGAPQFQRGDEIVAFIARWKDGVPMVAGYAEGLSLVSPDVAGNAMLHGGLADGLPMAELARQVGRPGR